MKKLMLCGWLCSWLTISNAQNWTWPSPRLDLKSSVDSIQRVMNDNAGSTMTTSPLTANTLETMLGGKTVKGGILGADRGVSFLFVLDVSSAATLLPTLTLKLKYGTGVLTLVSNALISASASGRVLEIRGRLQTLPGTNTQYLFARLSQDTGLPVLTGGSTILASTTTTVDSSLDQLFQLTGQLSTTLGNVIITPRIKNIIPL